MKIADLLDGLDLFQGFSYPDLETVSHYAMLEEVSKGTVIFQEGERHTHMFILVEGRIAIYKQSEHGRQLLSHEGKGRVVGEMALLDHEPGSATCIAETDCELVTLTRGNLDRLAAEHPGVAYRLVCGLARLLSRRLRRASGLIAEFLST